MISNIDIPGFDCRGVNYLNSVCKSRFLRWNPRFNERLRYISSQCVYMYVCVPVHLCVSVYRCVCVPFCTSGPLPV